MKKYSDWFKVDLHIHTDYSKQTKTNDYQGHFDINVLKQKLIENDVKLFSLTDHNIINVDAYKNYYENYTDGDPKLLIGCEFDIEVPESGKTITYHSVIVFENDNFEDVEIISNKIEELYTNKGGLKTERKITIDEIMQMSKSKMLEEAFGTGTAAVVSPIGEIRHKDRSIIINDGKIKYKQQATKGITEDLNLQVIVKNSFYHLKI